MFNHVHSPIGVHGISICFNVSIYVKLCKMRFTLDLHQHDNERNRARNSLDHLYICGAVLALPVKAPLDRMQVSNICSKSQIPSRYPTV